MADADVEVKIGAVYYHDDVSRFMNTTMREVRGIIDQKANTPPTVEQALLLREARPYISYREYLMRFFKVYEFGNVKIG